MMLAQLHGVSKYLSIDTDDCTDTVKTCGEWLKEIGWAVPRAHSYQTKESLALDIKAEFPQGVDLVFLDSNHDWYVNEPQYRGGAGYTYREICHIAPYLTADGCILLHDTFNHYAQEARGNNVDGAICRFVDENHEWEYIEHRPNGNGLGELRRK
jgi:hypothetical protein